MKISELLEKLGELQGIHGDIDVFKYDADGNYIAVNPEVREIDNEKWVDV